MEYIWLQIIFYALLLDSVSAVLVTWFGRKWYLRHAGLFSKYFPPAKGWAMYYLILVLFIGYLVFM